MLAPPPPPTTTLAGYIGLTLPDGRRAGICTEERPRCVGEHYVQTDSVLTTRGIVTCSHRPARGAPKCNKTLHLALLHFGGSAVIRGAGERFWFVIEVSGERLRHLRRIPMSALETFVFLGAGLPGVYEDLLKSAQREPR